MVVFGVLGIVGLVMAIGGGLILILFPRIMETKVLQNLGLRNGSYTFKNWKDIPNKITIKFYIFEISNPDNYTNLDDIRLVEKGPYVFDETRVKEEIVFYKNEKKESLVSFRERRTYSFRQDLSNGKYDDNITFINIPLLGIILNKHMPEAKVAYDLIADGLDQNERSWFTTIKVGDLLFDGVNLQLLDGFLPYMPPDSGIQVRNFSIIEGKSELLDEMSVYTGIDKMDKYGDVYRVDNKYEIINDDKNKTHPWGFHDCPAHSCNKFRGTDGTFFHPFVKSDQILWGYLPKLCRAMYFKYLEPSEVKGIPTMRFHIPKEAFESPARNPENSCYCLEKNLDDCKVNGAMENWSCIKYNGGAPITVSQAYFYKGDHNLRNDIHLVPPKMLTLKNYGSYVDIEPLTGSVLRGYSRLQMNVKVHNTNDIPHLAKTKEGKDYLIPALYIEEMIELDDKMATVMKTMIVDTKRMITFGAISSVIIGVVFILSAGMIPYLMLKPVKESAPIILND